MGQGGFENFMADMGERPAGRTIDRWPNPNGNYEKSNCRWATASEQARNRTGALSALVKDLIRINYAAGVFSAEQLAAWFGISAKSAYNAINRRYG
jgi:hypothetical protein